MKWNISQDSEVPVIENEVIKFMKFGQMTISVAHGPPCVSHTNKTDNYIK